MPLRALMIAIPLLTSAPAWAGGGTLEIEVIQLTKLEEGYELRFTQNKAQKPTRLLIQFGCSQPVFTCLLRKRAFSQAQHRAALAKLIEIARPGHRIKLGVYGSWFKRIESNRGVRRRSTAAMASSSWTASSTPTPTPTPRGRRAQPK